MFEGLMSIFKSLFKVMRMRFYEIAWLFECMDQNGVWWRWEIFVICEYVFV